jgi:hypothetical protein
MKAPPTDWPVCQPPTTPGKAIYVDLGTINGFALPLLPVAGTATPGNGTLALHVELLPPPDDIDAHLVRELPGIENQFDPLENIILLFALLPAADGLPARDEKGREKIEILSVSYSAPVDGQPGRFALSALRARLGSITLSDADFDSAELWLAPRQRLASLSHNTLDAYSAPGIASSPVPEFPFRITPAIEYAEYQPPPDESWEEPVTGTPLSRLLPWALGDSGISIELISFQPLFISASAVVTVQTSCRIVARDVNLQRYRVKITTRASGAVKIIDDIGPIAPGDARSGSVVEKSTTLFNLNGPDTGDYGTGTHLLEIEAETSTGKLTRFSWDIDWSNLIVV